MEVQYVQPFFWAANLLWTMGGKFTPEYHFEYKPTSWSYFTVIWKLALFFKCRESCMSYMKNNAKFPSIYWHCVSLYVFVRKRRVISCIYNIAKYVRVTRLHVHIIAASVKGTIFQDLPQWSWDTDIILLLSSHYFNTINTLNWLFVDLTQTLTLCTHIKPIG